jgi:hypothetical protein
VQHRGVGGPHVAHEAAPTATTAGGDEALLAQGGQRFPDGDRRDAEGVGQLGLGRQLLVRDQQAERDAVGQPAHHGLRAPARPERGEDRRTAAVALPLDPGQRPSHPSGVTMLPQELDRKHMES